MSVRTLHHLRLECGDEILVTELEHNGRRSVQLTIVDVDGTVVPTVELTTAQADDFFRNSLRELEVHP